MDFDHRIDWDNVKILKSESNVYRRRVVESSLINQKARSFNVINEHMMVQIFLLFKVCLSPINNV